MYIVLCQMKRKVWQLLVAMISIPGVYVVYGEKYRGGFTLCNNNNKMKEILPQTRHTIHLYGDKHDHFFYFNIFILKYYECS